MHVPRLDRTDKGPINYVSLEKVFVLDLGSGFELGQKTDCQFPAMIYIVNANRLCLFYLFFNPN